MTRKKKAAAAAPRPDVVHQAPRAPMAVLALDLGTRMGWATRDGRGQVTSGVEQLAGHARNESIGMAILRFRGWLRAVLTASGATLVAYEQPIVFPGRPTGARTAHNFEGVLLAELEDAHRDYVSVPPSLLKKHATGKGNSKKPVVREATGKRWGRELADEDEADALAVLAWAIDELRDQRLDAGGRLFPPPPSGANA